MYYILYTSAEDGIIISDQWIKDDIKNDIKDDIKNDIKNDIKDDINKCIICLIEFDDNKTATLFQDFTEYIINCDCNAYIHIHCFTEWYNKTNSCPICRKKICINDNYNNNLQRLQYYIIICNYMCSIIKSVYIIKSLLIIIYCIFILTFIYNHITSYNLDQVL
jgi:hypothetical protein